MKILEFLGLSEKKAKDAGSLFSMLDPLITDLKEKDAYFVVGLAGLLGRVANSDLKISGDELASIEVILREQASLSESVVVPVVSLLSEVTEELCGIEDHRYARMLNEALSREEKIEVLSSLFAVAAANESVSSIEEQTLRTIATELRIPEAQYVEVRSRYRAFRDVLKGLP